MGLSGCTEVQGGAVQVGGVVYLLVKTTDSELGVNPCFGCCRSLFGQPESGLVFWGTFPQFS